MVRPGVVLSVIVTLMWLYSAVTERPRKAQGGVRVCEGESAEALLRTGCARLLTRVASIMSSSSTCLMTDTR